VFLLVVFDFVFGLLLCVFLLLLSESVDGAFPFYIVDHSDVVVVLFLLFFDYVAAVSGLQFELISVLLHWLWLGR
jgi:hypothetical protein